jgi:uncharacterized protein YjbI with pentapeptide repeats
MTDRLHSKLYGTKLESANLNNAQLEDANMGETILHGVDMGNVKGANLPEKVRITITILYSNRSNR